MLTRMRISKSGRLISGLYCLARPDGYAYFGSRPISFAYSASKVRKAVGDEDPRLIPSSSVEQSPADSQNES